MFSRLPKVGKMNTPMHVRLLNLTAVYLAIIHYRGGQRNHPLMENWKILIEKYSIRKISRVFDNI